MFGAALVAAGMGAAACLGAYLVLIVTVRGHEVVVPDLSGMTPEEAEHEARRHELRIEVAGSRVEPRVAEGRIFEQQPRAGARTRPGRSVNVMLSLGHAALTVPDFSGGSIRRAQLTLERMGLRLSAIAYAPAFDRLPDTVIAQRPASGSQRQPGDGIALLVSRGAPERVWVMPALEGRDERVSLQALQDAGVRVGITRRSGSGQATGTVIEQRPAEGYPLRSRQAVQLVVSE